MAPPALAEITDSICINDALGNPSGNICTANDVRITAFTVVSGPTDCEPGEEYTATLLAEIESGPDRYGIGLWFNEDGIGARVAGTECTRDILTPAGPNASCDSSDTDGLGPFWDANGDACGDVTKTVANCPGVQTRACSEGGGTCAVHRRLVTVTTVCVDSDGDNIADISSCTSWDQSSGEMCTGILDTVPGTTSKCHCSRVTTSDIFVGCRSDADCSDGTFCNGAEVCNTDTAMCEPGTPPSCDDGVACTTDACDETADACTNTPDDSACDNGLFCDGSETCDPTNDCQAGTPPVCGDGVSCTVDSCNEATDACDNLPDDSICNDGAFCNGVETCDPTNDCQAGSPPDCSDGVSCTVDSCNEATDACDNLPDDSICNDGAFCNGVETCDAANDCQAGTAPDCSDGVSCTVDACNEDTDSCDSTPDDTVCDDGQFCNGEELCSPDFGCVNGSAPSTDDGLACTDDACDEETDTIVHVGIDTLCDDGNVCNGPEICDPTAGCVGTDPAEWPAYEGEACGSDAENACTLPDTCDDMGNCQDNNQACGTVTNSALCEFDMEPDKGVCVGGARDGAACSLADPDCPDGACEQSKQFRAAFSPDLQHWVSYDFGHTNPGQFYYNAFYDASAATDGVELALEIPHPFITQGATPLHVYDGEDVGFNQDSCYVPGAALMSLKQLIGRADWIQDAGYAAPSYLSCDQVQGPDGSGLCVLTVDIPQSVIDATVDDLLYVNLHLDYGFKGPEVDMNPFDGIFDAYDRGGEVSPWGSSDALVDTATNDGAVAIYDCTDYTFAHYDDGGITPIDSDSVQNLNLFKKFTGVSGQVFCSDPANVPIGGWMTLHRDGAGAVLSTEIDPEGHYAIGYAHKGKPADYWLEWCDAADCGGDSHVTASFPLKSKAVVGVDLEAVDLCDDLDGPANASDWEPIAPVYVKGGG